MRKIIFTFIFVILSIGAGAFEISETFTYNKNFWKNSFGFSQDIYYTMNAGFNFDLADSKDIPHHVYTFSFPLMFRGETVGLFVRPCFVPDTSNNASAYGAKLSWTCGLKYDEIENTSSNAFLSIGFAQQDAYITKTGGLTQRDNFYQLAYEGGIVLDFFKVYMFEISGSMFQYLSGISSVENVAGVLDQQNLADLGSFDYVLALPKGSAGTKIVWNSEASKSKNTLAYKFITFHDKDMPDNHSVVFSSDIMVNNNVVISLAYNHIFMSGKKDKDIFRGGISFLL